MTDSISSIFNTISVPSVKGIMVKCNYMDHEHFQFDAGYSEDLHRIFISYCREVSYSTASGLRKSIDEFLSFVGQYNELNKSELAFQGMADYDIEIHNQFQNYLYANCENANLATTRMVLFKSAITTYSKKYNLFSNLRFTTLSNAEYNSAKPLSLECETSLANCLNQHIEKIYKKIEFRMQVEASEPYTYSSMLSETNPHTLENIFKWINFNLIKNGRILNKANLAKFLANSADKALNILATQPDYYNKVMDLYQQQYKHADYIELSPFDVKSKIGGLTNWKPEPIRVLKTFLTHGFPFDIPLETIAKEYTSSSLINIDDCKFDIVKTIILRIARYNGRTPTFSQDELLEMYYPSELDMTVIVLKIMLETGWNKETVLSITPDTATHFLSGVFNTDSKVIQGEKNKSQGKGLPYANPQAIFSLSDKTDRYSAYNLIFLANTLAEPLQGKPLDKVGVFYDEDASKLFLCIKTSKTWAVHGRHTSLYNAYYFETGVKQFLAQYEIFENGERLKSAEDFTASLRPTWAEKEYTKSPLSFVATQMGHKQEDTTDIFYCSSGPAVKEREQRLRGALEQTMETLRSLKFRGQLLPPKPGQTNENSKCITLFSIPGMEPPLWGCSDQKAPDWTGFDKYIKKGKKCAHISKCLFCSRVMIFEDSLPYLMDRAHYLHQYLDDNLSASGIFQLRSELKIIEYIIDNWNDSGAVSKAVVFFNANKGLLPKSLEILNTLFQDD